MAAQFTWKPGYELWLRGRIIEWAVFYSDLSGLVEPSVWRLHTTLLTVSGLTFYTGWICPTEHRHGVDKRVGDSSAKSEQFLTWWGLSILSCQKLREYAQQNPFSRLRSFGRLRSCETDEGRFAWSLRLQRDTGSDLGPSRSNDSQSIKDTVGLICKHNLNRFLQGRVASLPIIIFTNDAISSPEDEYLGY